MSKDPAFPFYSQDFIMGCVLMSHEQVGIYIRLLCIQHQCGGLIEPNGFDAMVGNNNIVREKFIKTEQGYYNERLMEEMVKREKKSSNLSENAKKKWLLMQNRCKSDAIASNRQMPIEDEDESNTTTQLKTTEFKYLEDASFVACFNDYLEMRKKIRKPATERAKELALKSLHEHPLETAVKMLNQSIMNSWQGIFPLKTDNKLSQKGTFEERQANVEKVLADFRKNGR